MNCQDKERNCFKSSVDKDEGGLPASNLGVINFSDSISGWKPHYWLGCASKTPTIFKLSTDLL